MMNKTHLRRTDTATKDMLILLTISIISLLAIGHYRPMDSHALWKLLTIPPSVVLLATTFDLLKTGTRTLTARPE